MKTIITSNWRPLRRAVCTLLLGIAALWAMPRSARAQLYVSQVGNGANTGTVGTYDATTGAVTNANFITGVNDAGAIMLSGNTLFLANNGLFGTNGEVGTYNATTGAAINANLITGLTFPDAFALSGNDLFVATAATGLGVGKVGEYNATTGAVINANFITGLNNPQGPSLSGNNLFVADAGTGTVGEYNATLITPSEPHGLALSGNNLFVLNNTFVGNATVGEYDATTGAAINATLIPGLAQGALSNGIAVASVPEPWTWSLIAIGSVALLGIMLRRKHRTA